MNLNFILLLSILGAEKRPAKPCRRATHKNVWKDKNVLIIVPSGHFPSRDQYEEALDSVSNVNLRKIISKRKANLLMYKFMNDKTSWIYLDLQASYDIRS